MRSASWVVPAYAVAICVLAVLLMTGHTDAARGWALAPFAVLLAAMATAGRRPGRAFAVAGLVATAVMVGAFASAAADWVADAGLVVGSVMLAAAALQTGRWQALRWRRGLLMIVAPIAAVVLVLAVIALATELPTALHPPAGCVDTCMGPAIGVFLAGILIAEVLLLAMAVVAVVTSRITGLGALIVVVSENALFFMAPPGTSPAYAIAVAAWYTGLMFFAWLWIRRESAVPVPIPGQ